MEIKVIHVPNMKVIWAAPVICAPHIPEFIQRMSAEDLKKAVESMTKE